MTMHVVYQVSALKLAVYKLDGLINGNIQIVFVQQSLVTKHIGQTAKLCGFWWDKKSSLK